MKARLDVVRGVCLLEHDLVVGSWLVKETHAGKFGPYANRIAKPLKDLS